jgi:hypothetical protein
MPILGMILLYFGPDALMPIASAVAGIIGVMLMFWRRTVALVRAVFSRLFRRRGPASPSKE